MIRVIFSGGLPQLIFTNGGDVEIADIHGRFVRVLVPSQGRGYAVGVAYNAHSEIIFWSDTYTKKVSVLSLSDDIYIFYVIVKCCTRGYCIVLFFKGMNFGLFARSILQTTMEETLRKF